MKHTPVFLCAIICFASFSTAEAFQEPPNVLLMRSSIGGILGNADADVFINSPMGQEVDSDAAVGGDTNYMALPPLLAHVATDQAEAKADTAALIGRISAPPLTTSFTPDHEFSTAHFGLVRIDEVGPLVGASMHTGGYLQTFYGTIPGDEVTPSDENEWGTLTIYMKFLAVGPPEYLANTDLDLTTLIQQFPAGGSGTINSTRLFTALEQYIGGDPFRHRIHVGDSDLQLIHLGGGFFETFGTLGTSTEMSESRTTIDYFKFDFGSVNNIIISSQRVPLTSTTNEEIPVEVLQLSTTAFNVGPIAFDGDDSGPPTGTFLWSWVFVTDTWFECEDLSDPDIEDDDGDGSGGPGIN